MPVKKISNADTKLKILNQHILWLSALLSLQVPQEVPGGDVAGVGCLLDRRGQPDRLLHRPQGVRIFRAALQSQIGAVKGAEKSGQSLKIRLKFADKTLKFRTIAANSPKS
jgi:hypothetical protein